MEDENPAEHLPYGVYWDNHAGAAGDVGEYATFEEAQAAAIEFAESATDEPAVGLLTCEVVEWSNGTWGETGWSVTRGTPAPPYVLYLGDRESEPFHVLSPTNVAQILDGMFYDADRLGQGMEDGVAYRFEVAGGEDSVGHGVFTPGALISEDANGPSTFTWPLIPPDDDAVGDGRDEVLRIMDALAAE